MALRGQGNHRGVIELSSAGDVLLCTGEIDRVVVAEFIDRHRQAGTWNRGLARVDVVDVRSSRFLDSGAGELVWLVASSRPPSQGRITVRGASPLFVQVLNVVGATRLVILTD